MMVRLSSARRLALILLATGFSSASGLALAAQHTGQKAPTRVNPSILRVADAAPGSPPAVGTVYRYHLKTVFPPGPAVMMPSDIDAVMTVTAVDQDTHTVSVENYANKKLLTKAVEVLPNNPLMQPIRIESVPAQGQPFHPRLITASEKLNVDPAALFPLAVKKAWSSERTESIATDDPAKATTTKTQSICTVLDEPEIVVAAGTFPTFEIACFGRGPVPSGNIIRYYAPDIGLVVRMESVGFVSITTQLVSVTVPTKK